MAQIEKQLIEHGLPEFVKACQTPSDAMLLHQDAFGDTDEETAIFGKAMKLAGAYGKEVHIVPRQAA